MVGFVTVKLARSLSTPRLRGSAAVCPETTANTTNSFREVKLPYETESMRSYQRPPAGGSRPSEASCFQLDESLQCEG